jgi:putative intracellular protease/amidase
MAKRVLIAVSERGFWAEELLKPLDRLDEAGIEHDFIVGTGRDLPFPDPACLDHQYVDPPLGQPVTSKEMADRTKNTDWAALFEKRIALTSWMPIRPYLSTSQNYLRSLEQYYVDRKKAWERIDDYDGLLLVGGGGAVVDLANNNRLHDVILGFYYQDKPIAAECYCVACLAFAREFDSRKSLIAGKHVTGHTIEYDYTADWAVLANGDVYSFGSPPIPLEYILRDAVRPDGQFHGNVGRITSVVVDYPFITSRSVQCSDEMGRTFVKVLTEGLRRYGW